MTNLFFKFLGPPVKTKFFQYGIFTVCKIKRRRIHRRFKKYNLPFRNVNMLKVHLNVAFFFLTFQSWLTGIPT
jgi:hypothetical protein